MRLIKGFYMSLGMFVRIPLPFHIWDEKYTAIMVASLPLVGVIVGALWWLTGFLLLMPALPVMLTAAALALVPFFVTGFIHLDGYMDTSDAILSWRPLEDKLRIMKDPHVGSFAVIMLAVLLLLQFAAMYPISGHGRYLFLLITISVISRSCSAFSIFVLRHMPESNYVSMLAQNVRLAHKLFVVAVVLGATGLSFWYAGWAGLTVVAAVILGYAVAMRRAIKGFDSRGVSGDLLGFAMVISELCGLIALALVQ